MEPSISRPQTIPHLWHTLPLKTIEKELATNRSHGLSADEARCRLDRLGPNQLPEAKRDTLVSIFFSQFKSPLISVLLGASGILFFLHELTDALIILFVLIFNALVGALQEGRAQNTLAALKKFSTTSATVIRDGRELIVPDTVIVPGDILAIRAGDKIAADARLIESFGLRMDESALTGESGPIDKSSDLLRKKDLKVADRTNIVYKGTSALSGDAFAVVIATALETEIGKISTTISSHESEMPLKRTIASLSKTVITIVALICVSLFAIGVILGNPIGSMFATVVSLAVSIIPEGLPIVLTLVLANGVWRMAKRNALVKKLQAVEALGQVHVIAVDKTGTITRNELVVREAHTSFASWAFSGNGYMTEGTVTCSAKNSRPTMSSLAHLHRIATLSANAQVAYQQETGQWRVSGDPTEAALIVAAQKSKLSQEELLDKFPRLSEIPFTSELKFHATLHREGRKSFAAVTGAPEIILARCSTLFKNGTSLPLTPAQRLAIEQDIADASRKGMRILCCATKPFASVKKSFDQNMLTGLSFVGWFSIEDSLRPEAVHSIAAAQRAGIKIVMITGDHQRTAEALAREAGIFQTGDRIMTGDELEKIDAAMLTKKIARVSVFARVTPDQKLKIIQAYQLSGLTIAMTGDGVNDAPALVAADLGIAMGKIGTEVAKEAGDIVLLDDNFASIVAAVEEGRGIFLSLKRVILYLFSTSMGEVLTISTALIAGLPLPLLPAQIIWLNLVTDTFLDVSLAMEPKTHSLLSPTNRSPHFFDSTARIRLFLVAGTMAIGTILVFSSAFVYDMGKALTLSLTTLAAFQWFNAWNMRSETESIFRMNPFANLYLVGATLLVITLHVSALSIPFLQKILHTTPLSPIEWGLSLGVASTIIIVEEIRKFIHRQILSTRS